MQVALSSLSCHCFISEHLLSLLIFSPLIGIILLLLFRNASVDVARKLAVFSSLITFCISLDLLTKFNSLAGKYNIWSFQFSESVPWISSLGVNYTVGIDGLSLWLIVLTTLLTTLVIVASTSVESKVRSYLASILALEIGILGAFCALDLVLFYVFWEIMLVPMYLLIGIWGGERRLYAAIKFVLFTAFGSLLMLVAIVYLGYIHTKQFGQPSFLLGDLLKITLSSKEETYLFLAFLLAFSIKIPVFPLHTWLPDAHVEAPTGGSVILAGVLLKLGLYGLIRLAVPLFPHAMAQFAPLLALLGVIGIVFGALVAWVQTDIKKLVAYSSVSHLGFCVLGFAALNVISIQGSILQMINHGVSTAALFFAVGVLYDRKHTREIENYGGIAAKVPVFALVFLVFTLSSIGLPLTNGFIGEFMILVGSFETDRTLTTVAVSGVVLGAMYMLSLYRRMMFGEIDQSKNGDLEDLSRRERVIFLPLLVLVFVIGLFPNIILKDTEAVSQRVVNCIRLAN